MAIWVPPSVAEEAKHARREYERDIQLVAEKRGSVEEWDKVLAEIDPHLSIFFAPEWTNVPGITPGRFHLLLNPPDGIPSVMPLVGAVGEYVEPNSGMLDKLRESDMWNQAAGRERARRRRRSTRPSSGRSSARTRSARTRYATASRPRSTPACRSPRRAPWSYRAGARKRAA
jgi:hypothetical protein